MQILLFCSCLSAVLLLFYWKKQKNSSRTAVVLPHLQGGGFESSVVVGSVVGQHVVRKGEGRRWSAANGGGKCKCCEQKLNIAYPVLGNQQIDSAVEKNVCDCQGSFLTLRLSVEKARIVKTADIQPISLIISLPCSGKKPIFPPMVGIIYKQANVNSLNY